jgi:hypothetical protein
MRKRLGRIKKQDKGGKTEMTTVSYDVQVNVTVDILAEDLIHTCAEDIVLRAVDDMGASYVHDVQITVA